MFIIIKLLLYFDWVVRDGPSGFLTPLFLPCSSVSFVMFNSCCFHARVFSNTTKHSQITVCDGFCCVRSVIALEGNRGSKCRLSHKHPGCWVVMCSSASQAPEVCVECLLTMSITVVIVVDIVVNGTQQNNCQLLINSTNN